MSYSMILGLNLHFFNICFPIRRRITVPLDPIGSSYLSTWKRKVFSDKRKPWWLGCIHLK